LAVAVSLAGCAGAGEGQSNQIPAGTKFVTQKDGIELAASVGATSLQPGGSTRIVVTITNHRESEVMYASEPCFAQVTVIASLPLDPEGKTWDGAEAAFKRYALESGLAPGGGPATDPMMIQLRPQGCVPGDSFEAPLAPGRTQSATFDWKAEYVAGVPVIPQTIDVKISAGYDRQNGPPSYPPDYTGVRGSWSPKYKEIAIDGRITVEGSASGVRTAGQAVDAALGNAQFRKYVEATSIDACHGNVNLYLMDNPGGGFIPAGPAWNVESLCDVPRSFLIIAIDPITGDIKGTNACPAPCSR
jgi:hypothetical protein